MSAESVMLSLDELREAWPALSDEERVAGFVLLPEDDAAEFLSHLSARDAGSLISSLPEAAQRKWLSLLPPDDIADIVQEAPEEEQADILDLLDEGARRETTQLLAYDEDDAGGLMTPRFARLRAYMSVAEAHAYLRELADQDPEVIYYAYVVDEDERLVGVVSFRDLLIAPPGKRISQIMTTDVVSLPDTMDQEEVSRVFAHEDLWCLPVVDAQGRMKGIVTADDIVDVVKEEATEDMQKIGGTAALEAPYLEAGLLEMIRKRGGWLVLLLLFGFFTVEVMSQYRGAVESAVVLGIFVPLSISCGGNTGSQASTLVVRAMALHEVHLRDWWRVVRREVVMGLGLGLVLGLCGMIVAQLWNLVATLAGGPARLGEAPVAASFAVAASILCVVLWGTMVGSMLPFALRRIGADPASASAPLVATLVDATGLIIYFTVGGAVLSALG